MNEKGCDMCRNQHLAPLPHLWADQFTISEESLWFCGGGDAFGIAISYCPCCGRDLQEDKR